VGSSDAGSGGVIKKAAEFSKIKHNFNKEPKEGRKKLL